MFKIKRNDEKGFTLVEVIISVGVLCIVCGIIVQLFTLSGKVRDNTSNIELASVMAINAIEICKASDSPDIQDLEVFDGMTTNYEKTKEGFVIRKYFDENWDKLDINEEPVFVVKITMNQIEHLPAVKDDFGETVIISRLYEINVQAGYVDAGREGGAVLAEYNTSKYYTYMERLTR